MLPLAFTLVNLREQKLLALWPPGGGRLMRRCFYYSLQWREAREGIRGSRDRRVQWWDEDDPVQDDDTPGAEGGDDTLIDPSLDPSPRGHLDGFVETFVLG